MISICQSSIFKSVLFSAIIFVGFTLQVQLTSAFGTQESTEIDSTDNNLDGGFTQKVTSYDDGSVVVTNHYNDGSQDYISYNAATDEAVIKTFPAITQGSQDASDDIPSLPDLTPIDIILEPKDIDESVAQDNMEAGRYKPYVTITNNSCLPTNYRTSMKNTLWTLGGDNCFWSKNNVFINAGSLGKQGSFPAQLRIDFNSDGSWDYNEFVYSIGPLRAARARIDANNPATMPETVVVKFPNVTLPKGNHTIEVRVDPRNGAGSCGPDKGCIIETDTWNGRTHGTGQEGNNNLSETLRVREPNLNLGSYILNANNLDVLGSESGANRTIDEGDLIGLYWRGQSIDFDSCVGTTELANGNVISTGFTGELWPNTNFTPRFLRGTKFERNYDRTVKEPNFGKRNTYTITCDSLVFGGSVTASHRVCNDGCEPPDPPVITGTNATEVGTKEIFNFSATDPDGQSVRILIDWDRDGTIDQYRPNDGAYIQSGNSRNANYTWTGTGSYTFRARTEDETGLLSGWSTHTVTISQGAVTTSLICDEPDANNFGGPLPCTFAPPPDPACNNSPIDDDFDGLIDAADPGCWTDPTDPSTYDPNDNDETDPGTLSLLSLSADISVSSNSIDSGDPVTINWNSNDYHSCEVTSNNSSLSTPWVATDGSRNENLSTDTTFTLYCRVNASDPLAYIDDKSVSINSVAAQICSFTYGGWGPCIGGVETQNVTGSSPSGCVGGIPNPPTRSCTPPPTQCNNSPIDDDFDGLIDAADPGCWTDPTDPSTYDPNDDDETNVITGTPEITATPLILELGQPTTITWNTNGHVCTPSNNLPVAAADASAAALSNTYFGPIGSEMVYVYSGRTTYYLECGGVKYEVTVIAHSESYET